MKNNILVWVGDLNYTRGHANKNTGRRSLHGDFKLFKTIEDRAYFLNNYRSSSYYSVISCTKGTDRKYDLGCSVIDYINDIDSLDYEYLGDL